MHRIWFQESLAWVNNAHVTHVPTGLELQLQLHDPHGIGSENEYVGIYVTISAAAPDVFFVGGFPGLRIHFPKPIPGTLAHPLA